MQPLSQPPDQPQQEQGLVRARVSLSLLVKRLIDWTLPTQ